MRNKLDLAIRILWDRSIELRNNNALLYKKAMQYDYQTFFKTIYNSIEQKDIPLKFNELLAISNDAYKTITSHIVLVIVCIQKYSKNINIVWKSIDTLLYYGIPIIGVPIIFSGLLYTFLCVVKEILNQLFTVREKKTSQSSLFQNYLSLLGNCSFQIYNWMTKQK